MTDIRLRLLPAFALLGGMALACAAPAMAQQSAVPVSAAKTQLQDLPVWLRGLGTVQANYAVAIRPRVDGTLTDVPVTEGQDIKKGQLLAVIDPRPYQAALDA